MSAESPLADRRLRWAACAVAVAAAVGAVPPSAKAESRAIEQIERYCSTSWRNAGIDHQDWPDCTQQALLELLERLSRQRLPEAIHNADSEERRELNRTVWRTIKRWRRSPQTQTFRDELGVGGARCESAASPHAAWHEILAAARQCLSERQQRILELTRDGWRVHEIAAELDVSPARISDEKYKAISKLRKSLPEAALA
jgi:RNA polymerase sigma factor (sigma-70 family)